jgi:uncharacterized protein (DUF1810 family)
MSKDTDSTSNDPYQLNRFLDAQQGTYQQALEELQGGQKLTHWMWFVFPQIDGLGTSPMAKLYAIKSLEEARDYLAHPILGTRLIECCEALLAVQAKSATEIMGRPDDMKLQSSMTLFAMLERSDSTFVRILEKYFQGQKDAKTIELV